MITWVRNSGSFIFLKTSLVNIYISLFISS